MIWSDWRVARLALQIIAEQGPGRAYAIVQDAEDRAYQASVEALGG